VTLLLSTVETKRSGRVIGVSARASNKKAPAPVYHRTVIVGATSVTVAPGSARAVLIALNATGRHLLGEVRRLPVLVTANGTLIGATNGAIGTARVTLRSTR
jgi:hypothetical protein